MSHKSMLLAVLEDQVKPALGCTEPIAVAYAVAKAKEVLEESVEKVKISVDRNVYKNALAVFVPGTGYKGIKIAAALALVCGKSDYKLEVLKDVTEDDVKKAIALQEKDFIHIDVKKDVQGLYIETTVLGRHNSAKVILREKHDNIVLIQKNNKNIFKNDKDKHKKVDLKNEIQKYKISDLVNFIKSADLDDLKLVEKGIEMNTSVADAWMGKNPKLRQNIRKTFNEKDAKNYSKLLTIAACDARMKGYPLPIMSCAGSGNHGIQAIMPVFAFGDIIGSSRERIIRATALSILITIYIKSYTGTLSPICGCGVAAGTGAGCGIAYLLGGGLREIEGTIKNMVGGITGILCDGGKPGCAMKLSISTLAAIDAAKMALKGIIISSDDGIVDKTAEKSIQNLGKISRKMAYIDDTILEIMLAKSP